MRIDIDTQLSSISAFSMDLKRIQTPHSLFWDFGADKTSTRLQPVGQAAEFKFESKFEPLPPAAVHLAINPKGYSRRQSKVLTAKSMAKLLGARSGTAWAGRTGDSVASTNTRRFQVGCNRCGPRHARSRKTCYRS